MAILNLTKGKVAIVDDADFEWLSQWKWTYNPIGYAYRRKLIGDKKTCIYLHRFILDAPKDKDVDHINGDPLDNRRNNIRLCTTGQNLANRGKMSTNSSGYRGVIRVKNKWVAQIGGRVNGKRVNKFLGAFDDVIDAAKAHERALVERHGIFAQTTMIRKRG